MRSTGVPRSSTAPGVTSLFSLGEDAEELAVQLCGQISGVGVPDRQGCRTRAGHCRAIIIHPIVPDQRGRVIGCRSRYVALDRQRQAPVLEFERPLAEQLADAGENLRYLPGFTLPVDIQITSDLPRAIFEADILLCVTPSQHLRGVITHRTTTG